MLGSKNSRTFQIRAVSDEWRYVQYKLIKYHTNYFTYHPAPPAQNLLFVILNNPKNGHSGIKISESAILHTSFPVSTIALLQWIVYIAVRFVRIPLQDGRAYVKICMP